MENHVLRGMDTARRLGLRERAARLGADGKRRRPFEAYREQRMRNDPLRATRIEIACGGVVDTGGVRHGPARVDFTRNWPRRNSNQRCIEWHGLFLAPRVSKRPTRRFGRAAYVDARRVIDAERFSYPRAEPHFDILRVPRGESRRSEDRTPGILRAKR